MPFLSETGEVIVPGYFTNAEDARGYTPGGSRGGRGSEKITSPDTHGTQFEYIFGWKPRGEHKPMVIEEFGGVEIRAPLRGSGSFRVDDGSENTVGMAELAGRQGLVIAPLLKKDSDENEGFLNINVPVLDRVAPEEARGILSLVMSQNEALLKGKGLSKKLGSDHSVVEVMRLIPKNEKFKDFYYAIQVASSDGSQMMVVVRGSDLQRQKIGDRPASMVGVWIIPASSDIYAKAHVSKPGHPQKSFSMPEREYRSKKS